jgi:hypothetical protein
MNESESIVADRFTEFATYWSARAPLYAALAGQIALDGSIVGLLDHAEPPQRLPVLLFASVHDLLLDDPTENLAAWYPNLVADPRFPDDAALWPVFVEFIERHRPAIVDRITTRTTQTNEVGRCGSFLPVFGLLAAEVGLLGHLDVGASGGLNLLLDRYRYDYTDADTGVTTTVGESPVVVPVKTSGPVPLPRAVPEIGRRLGLDRSPIDVTDEAAARWLQACVWPEHADRFERLASAIEIARTEPPRIVAGDAVTDLAAAIAELGPDVHPVVTNSWVLNYLTPDERTGYLAELERLGAGRDLSWVYAEAPAQIPELPNGPDPISAELTVLTMVRWRDGARTVDHLATCHPHGRSIRWR